MSKQERIDSYIQPNEGTEYRLSVGEKLEAVKALSDMVDEMLLSNADEVDYQDEPNQYAKAKVTLNSVTRLDDDTLAAVSAYRTYWQDDSHEDMVVIYDIPASVHVYSTDGEGVVRRLDIAGENARALIYDVDVEVVNRENIALEQKMGLNNQPVDADEIAQLKQAVNTVLQRA